MRVGKLAVGREELFKKLSKKTGLTQPECRAAVIVLFDLIEEALIEGRDVRLGYGGLLYNRVWKARRSYNFRTKQIQEGKKDRRCIKFTMSNELQQRIRAFDDAKQAAASGAVPA